MNQGYLNLEWMLDHELKVARRFQNFVSLVMVSAADQPADLRALLEHTTRASDVYFDLGECGVILMSETDSRGALQAVARYQSACEGQLDLRFGLGCFPDDPKNAVSLLHTVYERLKLARAAGPSAVVSEG